jgi:hypothetical protein
LVRVELENELVELLELVRCVLVNPARLSNAPSIAATVIMRPEARSISTCRLLHPRDFSGSPHSQ